LLNGITKIVFYYTKGAVYSNKFISGRQAGRQTGRYTNKILLKDGKYVQNICYFNHNLLTKSYFKFGFYLNIYRAKMKETVILVLVSFFPPAPII
jgi:hypothetical protein